MARRASLIFSIVVLVMTFTGGAAVAWQASYWPESRDVGQLCIERREDMGSFNVVPMTVLVEGGTGAKVTLPTGGISVCFFLEPRTYNLKLEWPLLTWPLVARTTPVRVYSVEAGIAKVHLRGISVYDICSTKGYSSSAPRWVIEPRGGCRKL